MFELVYPSRPAPRIPRPNALSTWDEAPLSSEMLPVIDETGLVVGQATRAYCHSGSKVLHPVVHLQIIDRYSRFISKKGEPAKISSRGGGIPLSEAMSLMGKPSRRPSIGKPPRNLALLSLIRFIWNHISGRRKGIMSM